MTALTRLSRRRLAPDLIAAHFAISVALFASHVSAQGTLEDYRRASTISQHFTPLFSGIVQGGANWIGMSNQLWYRVSVRGGNQFVLVDAETWSKRAAFDHERLARALSNAASVSYTAITLPFNTFTFTTSRDAMEFDANAARWRCMLADYTCSRIGAAQGGQQCR